MIKVNYRPSVFMIYQVLQGRREHLRAEVLHQGLHHRRLVRPLPDEQEPQPEILPQFPLAAEQGEQDALGGGRVKDNTACIFLALIIDSPVLQ